MDVPECPSLLPSLPTEWRLRGQPPCFGSAPAEVNDPGNSHQTGAEYQNGCLVIGKDLKGGKQSGTGAKAAQDQRQDTAGRRQYRPCAGREPEGRKHTGDWLLMRSIHARIIAGG